MKPAFVNVCKSPDCLTSMNNSCDKILQCGHACCGFTGEKSCLPCLNEECVKANEQLTLSKNADDYCVICYTSGLSEEPCVQLKCKHIFHLKCILKKINNRWPGPRIVFSYLDCPECKQRISAPQCQQITLALLDSQKIEDMVLRKS